MEGIIKYSTLKLKKPERKIIEKKRRNEMKFLFSRLFSLIPPNYLSWLSKGSDVSDRLDSAIEYIEALKTNLDMIKNKKDKLSSWKISHEQTKVINNVCKPINIQIHEMSHDTDVVLVTGLKSYSNFRDVVWLLNQCTTEVTLANFSCSGHSIFHIRQKKVGAEIICESVKSLLEGSLNVKELENNYALFCTAETLSQPRWEGTESQPREIEELQMNFHKELSSVSSCNEMDYESNISILDFESQPREIEELQVNFHKELSSVSSCNELDYESNRSIWDFESQPREIEELQMNFPKELSSVSFCNELDYASNISIWDFDF